MEINRHDSRYEVSRCSSIRAPAGVKRALQASTMGLLAALVACEVPAPEGTAVIGVAGDAAVLLPVIERAPLDAEINQLLYLGLNSQRWEEGALEYLVDELSLAEGWEYGSDSLSITYRLRSDAVWSDGEPITAEDVVFTYELIRVAEIASPRADHWEKLDSVVAIGDREVTFFFSRRYPGMLFHTGVGIIPEHVFREHATDNATLSNHPALVEPRGQLVVSGPFQVAEWRRGEQLILVPNPMAFTRGPRLARVIIRIIADPNTLLVELENGSVDVMYPVPVSAAERLANDERFRIETVSDRFYDYVGWNGARYEPFADPDVRLALSLAIDRQEVLDGLEIAPYATVSGGPYPPIFSKLAGPGLQADPYLPDSALALLAAKGWRDSDGDGVLDRDGRPFRFTLLAPAGNERRSAAAQILQVRYAELGIDMELREIEFNALLDMMFGTRDFEAVLMGWRVGLEPDYVVGLFWPPDHMFNITGYTSATVDSLIDQAQSAATADEAAPYWRDVAREIATDHPYAFLWFFSELVAINERLQHTNVNTYGVYHNLHRWEVGNR